jgi:hypothetical protein
MSARIDKLTKEAIDSFPPGKEFTTIQILSLFPKSKYNPHVPQLAQYISRYAVYLGGKWKKV